MPLLSLVERFRMGQHRGGHRGASQREYCLWAVRACGRHRESYLWAMQTVPSLGLWEPSLSLVGSLCGVSKARAKKKRNLSAHEWVSASMRTRYPLDSSVELIGKEPSLLYSKSRIIKMNFRPPCGGRKAITKGNDFIKYVYKQI